MADENLKAQGLEMEKGTEGSSDTAHAPGAGKEQRPLDEALAGKPEAAPAPQQAAAAGPTAGAGGEGADGRGQTARPHGQRAVLRIGFIRVDREAAKTWRRGARLLQRRAPELMQKVVQGELLWRKAMRDLEDGAYEPPDGAPAGGPARVTPNFASALYLADSLDIWVDLAGGMAICVAAYRLLRRRLHAQPAKETTADALYLADQLEEAFGRKDGMAICDVAYSLLGRRLAYRSGTGATGAAPGQADTV
jgi:hypothetical protein